jgi:uncharacterized protein (TIGR02996 family)
MTPESQLLEAISAAPGDHLGWLALGDMLEEQGQAERAELLRLRERLRFLDPADADRPALERRLQELLSAGVEPAGPRLMLKLPGGVSLKMALIPPGSFWMGSPEGEGDGDEQPRHRVTLTQGFYLGVYPVTQAQWQAVMGSNPSRFKGEHRPVENVSWDDCQKFCEELGKKTGKRYRLPSEAEWEYACRAGTTTEYHTGDGEEALKRAGWCSYDGTWGSGKETKPVGKFERNAWGLFDMHGNVWEWCLDDKREYTKEDYTDIIDRTTGGVARVLHGGSWYSSPSRCRAAYRYGNDPDFASVSIGLRVVLCLD